MERQPIDSSTIESAGHDGVNRMQLKFHSGAIYDYHGVPSEVHKGLMNAKSAGTYFGKEIRGKFKHSKVEGAQ